MNAMVRSAIPVTTFKNDNKKAVLGAIINRRQGQLFSVVFSKVFSVLQQMEQINDLSGLPYPSCCLRHLYHQAQSNPGQDRRP